MSESRWQRFWFASGPPEQLALFRIAFAVVLLWEFGNSRAQQHEPVTETDARIAPAGSPRADDAEHSQHKAADFKLGAF